jgi:hypothetical protein
MLYVGWNISEYALKGFGALEQAQYQSLGPDMRVYLLQSTNNKLNVL